jgi:Leucine-rich repeat (LRR) protein
MKRTISNAAAEKKEQNTRRDARHALRVARSVPVPDSNFLFDVLPCEILVKNILFGLYDYQIHRLMFTCKAAFEICPEGLLELLASDRVYDSHLVKFRNLAKLHLAFNNWITDRSIRTLQKLVAIDLGHNTNVTGESLAELPNLTALSIGEIGENRTLFGQLAFIQEKHIKVLAPRIKWLELQKSDNRLRYDPPLRKDYDYSDDYEEEVNFFMDKWDIEDRFTSRWLMNFTNVTHLSMWNGDPCDLSFFGELPRLTHLHLGSRSSCPTLDYVVGRLTQLTFLGLGDGDNRNDITDAGLRKLTNLTELDIGLNTVITSDSIACLTKLKAIYSTYDNPLLETIGGPDEPMDPSEWSPERLAYLGDLVFNGKSDGGDESKGSHS